MQIIINVPDDMPAAVLEQQVEAHKSENTLSFEQAMDETLEQNKELYKCLS